jgi:hypothetical protein
MPRAAQAPERSRNVPTNIELSHKLRHHGRAGDSTRNQTLMGQSLDRPLADMFVACRDYYLANPGQAPLKPGQMYSHLRRALTATLRAMASLHAASYSGYNVDRYHPGYLIRFDPPMLFRVPYHVLPSFPNTEQLSTLWQLSREIRCSDRSTISISGSIVLRKIFDVIGDVVRVQIIQHESAAAQILSSCGGANP